MSERRLSSRTRKQVDYAAAGDGRDFDNEEDDEDFAVSSKAPPAKKQRTSKEQNSERQKTKRPEMLSNNDTKVTKERLFERELERAMKLSQEPCAVDGVAADGKMADVKMADISTDIAKVIGNVGATDDTAYAAVNSSVELHTAKSSSLVDRCRSNDKNSALVSAKNSLTAGAVIHEDKKSDHVLDDDDEEEEEDEEEKDENTSEEENMSEEESNDSDSSFNSGRGHKANKGKTKPVLAVKEKELGKKMEKSKSPGSDLASSAHKVPASLSKQSRGQTEVTAAERLHSSPTSGVLRLGLSRNVRVKSLHPIQNSIRS